MRILDDLAKAMCFSGDLMTWEELATKLGVKEDTKGDISSIKLANACLQVTSNPRFLQMKQEERIRLLATAAAALPQLLGSA